MRATTLRPAIAALVLGATLVGCGYKLSGGVSLPDHIQVIAVVPFDNRTKRPEIEQRVTEAVAGELNKRSKIRVAIGAAGANAVLEGAITSYRTTPVQFGTSGRQNRAEAIVTLQATLRDTADDKILWSQSGLTFKEQFDVADTGAFFDEETVALDSIARGAAEVLVTSMVEGFE
jgi:TolB-like protein